MIPTLCAASLLPLHLYREGTHAESDTASPLFFRKPSEEMQPAASSLATHCNGQHSGLQRKGQRHERTAALIHYIYRSAEQRTAKRQRYRHKGLTAVRLYAYLCPEGHLTKIDSNQASDIFSELKRDKQGRLLSYVAGDFDCYEASRYTYDSTSGLLKTISNECPDSGSDVTTYIYDNKGYAVKMEVKGSRGEMGEEPEPYESAKTFTYDGFDSKGNWTLRKGKDSTEKTEWTETRIITYFE